MKTKYTYYKHRETDIIYKKVMGYVFTRYINNNFNVWQRVGLFSHYKYRLDPIVSKKELESIIFLERL